jgi:transcriptional repressor NrdR
MRCPYCLHEETKVIDTRDGADLDTIRRRRECLDCGRRFTTYERIEISNMSVIKKNGQRERFDREKVVRNTLKACEKRPISRETIEAMVDEITLSLIQLEGKEVPSTEIGEMVMERLKKLDNVAYIRFASVYRDFSDISSFEEELVELREIEQSKSDNLGGD